MSAAIVTIVAMQVLPAAAEPVVLHFAPGAFIVRASGRMSVASHERRYALDVRKGQTLTFDFDGDGPLIGTVACKGGGEGPFSGVGDTFVVPESGPCILTLLISRMAEPWNGSYRLAVTAR